MRPTAISGAVAIRLIREVTAVGDIRSQRAEEVRRHAGNANLFRRAVFRLNNGTIRFFDAGEVLKCALRLIPKIGKVGKGKSDIANITLTQVDAGDDNAIRVLIGQWAQKDPVRYSEDCGAGTNSQRYGCSCKHVRKEALSQRPYRSSN